MTMLPKLSIAAAVLFLVSPTGMSANAQSSSACYQTCRIQYNWPASQCSNYCRELSRQQAKGGGGGMYGYTAPAPAAAPPPAPAKRAFPGGCGTYMYWTGSGCADARKK